MRSSRHALGDLCTLQAAHHYSNIITKGYTFTVGFEKGGRSGLGATPWPLWTRCDNVAAPDSARQHGRFRTRRDNVAGPLRPRPTPSVGHILWVGIVGHLVPPPVRTGPTLVSARTCHPWRVRRSVARFSYPIHQTAETSACRVRKVQVRPVAREQLAANWDARAVGKTRTYAFSWAEQGQKEAGIEGRDRAQGSSRTVAEVRVAGAVSTHDLVAARPLLDGRRALRALKHPPQQTAGPVAGTSQDRRRTVRRTVAGSVESLARKSRRRCHVRALRSHSATLCSGLRP